MIPIRVIAIPSEIAESVRETSKDPHYGFPAFRLKLAESAPCRHCLRRIPAGEGAILFTLDAFEQIERLPLPGPVYIHAQDCARYPERGGYPEELREGRTLNAYGRGRRLRAQEYTGAKDIESRIQKLLAGCDVDYIHVRSTGAGCFTFRIERMSEPASK